MIELSLSNFEISKDKLWTRGNARSIFLLSNRLA